MKKFVLTTLTIIAASVVFGQQDYQWTQFMFGKVAINPGSAAHKNAYCATGHFRQQWIGFDGAPQQMQLALEAPLPIRFIPGSHGAGLTVFQDQLGQTKFQVAKLAYAYRRNLFGPGELGIGIDGSFVSASIGNNWLATDDYTTDTSIPNDGSSDNTFNMGFGLYYHVPEGLYVGISTTHLLPGNISADGGTSATSITSQFNYSIRRHYWVIGGYEYKINQEFTLLPNILLKSDFASTQVDVNAMVLYNNFLWGGVSYRIQDAAAVLVGIDFTTVAVKGLKLGLSYDITTSQLRNHSSGGAEVMLNYCFKIKKKPKIIQYKSVRFL